MDNHYHLLLSSPTGVLSRPMRHLDGLYTQKFNRVHHRDGPLFRGRYKAILIDAEEYFLSVVRYIHKNPLGAGIVSDIDRYRWSSHWGYLNKKQCPDWLDTRSVISRFGGLNEYQRFMHEEVEEKIEEFYHGPYQKPVLGSKEFIGRVTQRLGDKARVEEEKPESRRLFSPSLDEIVEATARGYGKTVQELKRRKRGGGERGAAGSNLSRPAIGWAQARGDRKKGGIRENIIGELGLFTDEGASSEREGASPKSSKN